MLYFKKRKHNFFVLQFEQKSKAQRPHFPLLFLQYLDDLPSFHPTFFQSLLYDHILTSWMGQREMRPTADPNGEVIVMEM